MDTDVTVNDVPDVQPDRMDADVAPPCGMRGQACCMTMTPCSDPGLMCTGGTCVPRCGAVGDPCCAADSGLSQCPMGVTCVADGGTGGTCVDRRCEVATQTMCATGTCVDTSSSVDHCGMCNNACPRTGANVTTGDCMMGRCRLVCAGGFEDCDGNADNGCEVNLRTDANNCGMCRTACSAGARMNVMTTCSAGVCNFPCMTGFGDCDGNAANGCEANLNTDTRNCGMCGMGCMDVTEGRGTCASGACEVTCNTGFVRSGTGASATCLGVNPRPVAPLSGALVQPTRAGVEYTVRFQVEVTANMRWAVEFCADRACATSLAVSDPQTAASATIPVPARDGMGRPRQVIFWRTQARYTNGSPSTTTFSAVQEMFLVRDAPTTGTGSVWAYLPDVNVSGRPDIILGDPGTNRVFIHNAPPSTTTSGTAAVQILSAPAMAPAGFGTKVSATGDVSGDGIPDLLVASAPGGTARVYVYHGTNNSSGATTLPAAPSTTLTAPSGANFALAAAGLGDVNNDGYGDVGVLRDGALLVYSGAMGGIANMAAPSQNITWTGISTAMGAIVSLAPAGDVNNDGIGDVVIGVSGPNTGSTAGQARVYYGSAMGLSGTRFTALATTTMGAPAASFGRAVSGVGDFTGDGFVDVAVGQSGSNQVFVFPGAMTNVSTTPMALTGGSRLGATVSGGDFNGDGRGDILVGNEAGDNARYVIGGTTTFAELSTTATDFGYTVNGFNDVNGDGFTDAMVGTNTQGTVYVYFGSMSGPSATLSSLVQIAPAEMPTGTRYGSTIAWLRPVRRTRAWF
jgi:hypothetical protein